MAAASSGIVRVPLRRRVGGCVVLLMAGDRSRGRDYDRIGIWACCVRGLFVTRIGIVGRWGMGDVDNGDVKLTSAQRSHESTGSRWPGSGQHPGPTPVHTPVDGEGWGPT